MASIKETIESTGGKPTGFDFLRISLSILILVFHSRIVTGGGQAQDALLNSWLGPFCNTLLPIFFSLSGFLVTASLLRARSLVQFMGLRALRIFPALVVDTLFCALIIGPLFTSLSLADYFASTELHRYLLNAIGNIHYHLPGVFDGNPTTKVNGQLWTIPYELECYAALAALSLLTLVRRRALFLALLLLTSLGLVAALHLTGHYAGSGDRTILSGRSLVLCFLFGSVAQLYADKIPRSKAWLCVAAASLLMCTTWRELTYAIPIPAAYLTAYLGSSNVAKPRFLAGADYSYGVFLYSYPIQQALYTLMPRSEWWLNAALALLPAILMAAFSWHVVEKRCLGLRRYLER